MKNVLLSEIWFFHSHSFPSVSYLWHLHYTALNHLPKMSLTLDQATYRYTPCKPLPHSVLTPSNMLSSVLCALEQNFTLCLNVLLFLNKDVNKRQLSLFRNLVHKFFATVWWTNIKNLNLQLQSKHLLIFLLVSVSAKPCQFRSKQCQHFMWFLPIQ